MNLSNLPHRPAASFVHCGCIVDALKMNDALSAVKHSESTGGEGILRHSGCTRTDEKLNERVTSRMLQSQGGEE